MTPTSCKYGGFLFYALANTEQASNKLPQNGKLIRSISNFCSFVKKLTSPYLLAVRTGAEIRFDHSAVLRLWQIAEDTQAGIVYSDYLIEKENRILSRPLIDYQPGSIRSDFNFGYILLFSQAALRAALQKRGALPAEGNAVLYDLRLKISINSPIVHLPEALYTVAEKIAQPAKQDQAIAEPQFAYVAHKNLREQKMLEKIATRHLKSISAYLKMRTQKTPEDSADYPVTASVIIPVLNRKRTIAAAMESALGQQTSFNYNIILVDNHSTDGTTQIIKKFAARHPQIRHVIPARRGLHIGGCWNEGIYSPCCGRFAVQLDSDDLYCSPHSLQTIVDALQAGGKYAMVIGSYIIVNERLEKIPPGLVEHREWTKANGHNNALRINGLGAPRAFRTIVLRRLGFPNVSYGEDYAVALRISRTYQIGRIYENLYLCRRWSDNTDAALSPEKQNDHDFYKDKLRTWEIQARQIINKSRQQ